MSGYLIREEISYTVEEHYHKDSYLNNMIFDGNNYTISNLSMSGEKSIGFIGITSSCFTIQNITFDNAYASSTSGWVSIVISYCSNEVTLSNVNVLNCQIGNKEHSYKAGAIIGMGQLGFGSLTIKDCAVTNTILNGTNHVGGLVGQLTGSKRCYFNNNIVKNCTFNVK